MDEEPKQAAADKLKAFCDENHIGFEAQPMFIKRDDGTFSVIVQLKVEYTPPPKAN